MNDRMTPKEIAEMIDPRYEIVARRAWTRLISDIYRDHPDIVNDMIIETIERRNTVISGGRYGF